jgi:mutator family transposase
MGKSIREAPRAQELEPVSLSELIHREIRVAIETAVHEELRAALGTTPYERSQLRRGYRNGTKTRTLTGPTGPVARTLPRATLFAGAKEWTSRIVPRYHRRMPEVSGQRADARRRRRPVRRPEAATCPRSLWRRIVRRVERGPGQSCGARVAGADPGDHRRQRWTAARRRGRLRGSTQNSAGA